MEKFFETLGEKPDMATLKEPDTRQALEYGAVETLFLSKDTDKQIAKELKKVAGNISANIEIISKNHGLVIWGKENSTNIQSGNKLIKISKNIFTVLDEIEDLLKKTNNNFPIFYSGILAYESANFIENIPRAKSFYNLPDYYFIFPGNTLLIDHTKKEIYYELAKELE